MLNAKDFFRACDDDMVFEIKTDNRWFGNLDRMEIIAALDKAMLFEGIYTITFFTISHIEERLMYVTLDTDHIKGLKVLADIFESMGKIDDCTLVLQAAN